jgi:hypothetical protein
MTVELSAGYFLSQFLLKTTTKIFRFQNSYNLILSFKERKLSVLENNENVITNSTDKKSMH